MARCQGRSKKKNDRSFFIMSGATRLVNPRLRHDRVIASESAPRRRRIGAGADSSKVRGFETRAKKRADAGG
jgi:hypothetical protein